MKDASVIATDTAHAAPVHQEVEECCGSCKFFLYEDTDGFGYCRKFDTADVRCSDDPCKLYKVSK